MDEKRAFEAMMAELGDSDSDDGNRDVKSSKTSEKKGYRNTSEAKGTPSEPKESIRDMVNNNHIVQTSHKFSKEEEEIMSFGERPGRREVPRSSVVDSNPISRSWLMKPCYPGDSPMLCYIERQRSNFGGGIMFRAYLEVAGDPKRSKFLMSAKKLLNKRTSYYLVSTDAEPGDDRGSDDLLGKVRANAVGSRYLLTDHGVAPSKSNAPSMHRKEFGVIKFEFDSDGPSQIQSYVPSVNASGVAATWQPESEYNSIEDCVERGETTRLLQLKNKKPKWDEAHGGHVLNFQGRVTESSVKNFQLVCESLTGEDVVLQFGRVGKNKFTMDVKYPLSPFQAFGMCIACMDGKIADRKGYEFVRKLADSIRRNDDAKKG